MSTLWLRFAQDSSLPASMDETARKRFENIFDGNSPGSLWSQAVKLLGLRPVAGDVRLLYWHGGVPYVNWSHMTGLISAGLVSVAPAAGGGFGYKTSYRLSRLFPLIRSQWKIARYILTRTEPGFVLPADNEGRIRESLALGLALLSVTMRLPPHTPEQLASWLADPEKLTASLRRTIVQLHYIQQLRTALSPAWNAWFAEAHGTVPSVEVPHDLPEYFWDVPPALQASAASKEQNSSTEWRGMGVCGVNVTGRAVLVTRASDRAALQAGSEPLVFVFALARPESVEWYEGATAVLFGEGGIMSHACTVAREQNLPCITALGKGFISRLKEAAEKHENVWLSVRPEEGRVELLRG